MALLNGWWDILPVARGQSGKNVIPRSVPHGGWRRGAYLVPGFFTDHYYPEDWRKHRSAWTRTFLEVSAGAFRGGRRAFLLIKAAIPRAFIFVNGRLAGVQEDMFIGDELDVTALLEPGRNELAVFLTEFPVPTPPDGSTPRGLDYPWGCCIASDQAGIWQDVLLEWRPSVRLTDLTVRTSMRENRLTVIARVRNDSRRMFSGRLTHAVEQDGRAVLQTRAAALVLAPGAETEVTVARSWRGYRPWSPESPELYGLSSKLIAGQGDGERVVDSRSTRFGFRELWIEGHRMLLNGRPQRWGGEWCHKSHAHWLRPEYVRQWFRMLKDLNMNYVRLHTFPHPEYFFDIADEMGILLCEESAVHGSASGGTETPGLWPRLEAHYRRIVRRDKNHPSLVIYSVENEMRWNLATVPGAKHKLPEYRKLLNELDPTRPAYHEGDSSLWNEDRQETISRHYGPACHGLGWWDKKLPLHAGEMGRWHYASPYTALQWKGDVVFTDYALTSESIALDAARIIELGRANEVSCQFPWNLSGLDNPRPAERRTFEWPDPNTPYAKPLAHKPYESEFAWWDSTSGYRPGSSFEIVRRAFRPLAAVVRQERRGFYADREAAHTVYAVNDLPMPVTGCLTVTLECGGEVRWQEIQNVCVDSGMTQTLNFCVPLHAADGGRTLLRSRLACGMHCDEHVREIDILPADRREPSLNIVGRIGVVGECRVTTWLGTAGVERVPLARIADAAAAGVQILIIAAKTIEPDAGQAADLRRFVADGGRVLALEQTQSILPGAPLARMPIEWARVRDGRHPVMAGIADEDLRFFGDDPFGLPSSDAWVTVNPYIKPRDGSLVRALADSSGGDFGSGGLQWAPLIETTAGKGTMLGCQFRLEDCIDEIPVAARLMRNMLNYLSAFEPVSTVAAAVPAAESSCPARARLGGVTILRGDRKSDPRPALRKGATVIVWGVTPDTSEFWSGVAGQRLQAFRPEPDVYHVVANAPDAGNRPDVLRGLSNEDTCWLDNWTYKDKGRKDIIVDYLLEGDGFVTHLVSCPRSGLDLLYGQDNATEWKRMPALSALLDAPLPRAGAALAEIRIGSGRLIFCQLRWQPDLWAFRRFYGMLMWNLGVHVGTDALSGDFAEGVGRRSEGFPTRLRVARAQEEDDRLEIISRSKRREESYASNEPFREWEQWRGVETPDGLLPATVEGEGPILIGIEVTCSEPRKFRETLGGLPNPDLQTFLRLEGRGRLRAWINGEPWSDQLLNHDAPTYVSDIDFESGANYVVLEWTPADRADALRLGFENKDRRPETTFGF